MDIDQMYLRKETSPWRRRLLQSVPVALSLVISISSASTAMAEVAPVSSPVVEQSTSVSGRILDVNGEPLIGVNILEKGTTNGTISDFDGNFTLNVGGGNSVLVFSYIGYVSQELKASANMSVVLKEDSETLDEVVVVGYGTQKKVNVTGAVSMVGADVIQSRPVANVTQALQGSIPGLNLTASSNGGDLNSSMSFNIRGTGSISSSDSPLVLIDGIEGDLNLVNPNDIESVSVLKDAASSSIYGARAAFGVILVTTKSGKEGKVKVSYSGDVRFNTATQLPDMLDSYSFAQYFNEAARNAGAEEPFKPHIIENIIKYQNGEFTDPNDPAYWGTQRWEVENKWAQYQNSWANTDWFNEFYKKNVPSTQHNLSFSGGTEKFNWLVSGSFLLQNGLIRHGHDELNRYTMNVKIGAELAKWIRLDYSSKWSRKNFTKPQYLSGTFFHNIARRWPTCPAVNPSGKWADGMEIAILEDGGIYNEYNDNLTQQVKFTIEPIKNWKIYLDGSISTTNNKYKTSQLPIYLDTLDGSVMADPNYTSESYVSDERFRQDYFTANIYTDYTHSFGVHNMKVMLGMNYERYNQDNLWGSGKALTSTDKPYLSQAQKDYKTGDSYWNRATAGYFARINYDYDGKYLAEFNIRYDGSSRFIGDQRWAWFPSVSLGWNIARESFFGKLSEHISTLKLRASWGQLGNTSSYYNNFTDWYPFYLEQGTGSADGGWLINGKQPNTAYTPGIINNDLTWETIETWDIGLDWAALNNRLTGSFDWFRRNTRDMVGPPSTLGSVLGINPPSINNCDMQSNGWELEIGWRDQIGEVKYGARLNLSDSKQKILSYPNETGNIWGYNNGYALNNIWGYESVGIAGTQEEMDKWIAGDGGSNKGNKPNWGANWGEGDVMFKDQNGDGIVNGGDETLKNHGDLKILGNSTPRYRIGINLDVEWKGIDFSAFFQGVLKRDWAFPEGDPYFWGVTGDMWQSAAFEEHLDYWTESNKDAYYPKPYFGGDRKNQKTSSMYIQNASYLRLKNIQLGYTLPRKVVEKAGMENCRIYLSCDNLFTITSLSSVYDPEAFGSYGNSGTSGKTYPMQRTIAVGVSLNF